MPSSELQPRAQSREGPAPVHAGSASRQPRAGAAEQQSLYRRHRPRTFAEVVGQEAVVRTLRNAVERGRVHHAYLFVGSRGTGKTSMAKILAACLNCERGPTVEPCGTCEACRAIAQARSLDVIEMDAASNNSVDDIRELREGVAFAPVSGRSKVYILDEAHMLSTAAWNAFLKTLEEPPPGTVFVLATTEAQKVPATVVDRCHRFDFQRPTVEQIADVLRRAAAAESIAIPPAAIAAVARSATGSFRDALGTLEQLVTYGGREIVLADVLAVLGATETELLEEAIDAVDRGEARAALLAVARCAERGRDAGAFAADLEIRARELLVVQTLGEVPAELALTPEADAGLAEQATRVAQGSVVRVLEQLAAALEAVKAGADPRTQLELALVKAARPEVDGSLRALLTRIERLERGMAPSAGGVAVEGGPPPAAPVAFAGQSGGHVQGPPVREPPVVAGPVESSAATVPVERRAVAEPVESLAPAVPVESLAAAVPVGPPAAAVPVESPAAAQAVGLSAAVESAEPSAAEARAEPVAAGSAESTPVPTPAPAALTSSAAPEVTPGVDDFEALAEMWPAVVELVGVENKLLSAVLAQARPVAVRDGELRVAFAQEASFLKKKAEDRVHRATVTAALRELSGDGRLRVEYELRADLPAAAVGEAADGPRTEEEWVARFVEEFDAEELTEERVLVNGAHPSASEPASERAIGE